MLRLRLFLLSLLSHDELRTLTIVLTRLGIRFLELCAFRHGLSGQLLLRTFQNPTGLPFLLSKLGRLAPYARGLRKLVFVGTLLHLLGLKGGLLLVVLELMQRYLVDM